MSSSTDLRSSRTGRPNAYKSDPPTLLCYDPPNQIQNKKPPSEVLPEHAGPCEIFALLWRVRQSSMAIDYACLGIQRGHTGEVSWGGQANTKTGAVFTSGPEPETTGLTEGGRSWNIRHLDRGRSTLQLNASALHFIPIFHSLTISRWSRPKVKHRLCKPAFCIAAITESKICIWIWNWFVF